MQKDRAQIMADVQKLISRALQVDLSEVLPDLAFGDIPQWDSMGHMEVMILLDQDYSVEINADTISQLVSIPEIIDYILES
jgi:acyl carrier protein